MVRHSGVQCQIGGAMRQTQVGADHGSAAHQDTVRAETQAGRTTSLPPHAAPVTAVPPTAVAGVVSPRSAREEGSRLRRWLSGHAQLVTIAGLVALASLATAALVTTGARQLNSAPSQTTTPYIAAQPNGPVHAPNVSSTTGPGAPAASEDAAPKSVTPDRPTGRSRGKADPPAPGRPRTPERTIDKPPRTPEMSNPPADQPPSVTPRVPRECRVAVPRALGRCVAQIPEPPRPPPFPSPPRRAERPGVSARAAP